jgi:hypothetical protein
MELTDLDLDFLRTLLGESWMSPPMFDHEVVERLVELGFVETEALPPKISNTACVARGEWLLPRKRRSAIQQQGLAE